MQQRSEIYKTVGAGRKIYVGVGQSHELLLPERHRSAKGAGSRKESAGKSYPGVRHGGNVRSVFTWYFDEDNDCPFITMDYGGGERYAYPSEIRRTLARVANMALNGEIDSKTANTIILACNAVLGSIRTDEQQKKIDELEVILNDITKKP